MAKIFFYLFVSLALLCLCSSIASSGTLDTNFGVDGQVTLEIGTHADRAQAIAIQPDGKILLGGGSTDGVSLACSLTRLLADGSPDPTFGENGTQVLDLGSGDDEILALGLTPDGHILAAGYTDNTSNRDFALLRLTSTGSLDTNFGDQGKVITSVGNSDDEISALVAVEDGGILVAGSASGTNGRVMVLARYLENGQLDSGFADQGLSLIGIGKDVLAQGMVLNADGDIIVSGSYTDGESIAVVLAGFDSDGQLDQSFGEYGVATTAYTGAISEGYGLFQAQDGSLFVAGSVGAEGERAAALYHFSAQGIADTSFGESGVLVSEISPEDDVLYSLAGNATSLSSSGFTTTNGSREFLLLTYDLHEESEQPQPTVQLEQAAGSLHIGALQVEDSLSGYTAGADVAAETLQPVVLTTSFGQGESISYAMAMQDDGKVVTVGTAGDNDITSVVVARYGWAEAPTGHPASLDDNLYISTTMPSEVTATVAHSGGVIHPNLEEEQGALVTQRGVVFSVTPYPVCKGDCISGDTSTTFAITSSSAQINDAAAGKATLSATTNKNADCTYTAATNSAITGAFSGDGTTSHKAGLTGLTPDNSYTYNVYCVDSTGTETASDQIAFKVSTTASLQTPNTSGELLANAAATIGNFLVPSAHANTLAYTTTSTSESAMVREGYTSDGAGSGNFGTIMDNLIPDTRYYVRAYAIVDGKIFYGPQVDFETATACFIATAAYGSILHPAVALLRDVRDRYLQTNTIGRQLVAWYYTHSPPLADKIALSPTFRFFTRVLLLPVLATAWLLLHPGSTGLLFLFFCGITLWCLQSGRQQQGVTP